MIIDKKGRLFGKVSIIDVLALVIVIAIAVFVGGKFKKSDTGSPFTQKEDKIQIVYVIEELRDFVADELKIGDPARESVYKASFGNVVDIKRDKSVSWVRTNQAKLIKSSKEGYSCVYITMEGTGIYGDNGVTIGSGEYFIGQSIVLNIGKTQVYGKICDMKKIG
ncbi:MAG TPA: DUF4330 domain-containing protein [Clostridiaceae bacterium]|nr:DUF4330 domain-containing protein [Clostridiaceae bacterium]